VTTYRQDYDNGSMTAPHILKSLAAVVLGAIQVMLTDQIVQLLIAERARLQKAIDALQGSVKRRGRPRKNPAPAFDYNAPNVPDWVKPASARKVAPKKRKMSAAGRKAIGDAGRKRWAAIRAGKAPSPFAAKKKAKKKAKKN
jgi:hypothetical protein